MEILVHVSAPSSAADDARYQAQIAAMLSLQPVSSVDAGARLGDATVNSSTFAPTGTVSTSASTSAWASASASAFSASALSADTRPSRLHDTQSAVTAVLPCSPASADGLLTLPESQSESQFQSESETESGPRPRFRSRSGQGAGPGLGPAPDLRRVCSAASLATIGPEALAPVPLVPLAHLQKSAPDSNFPPELNSNSNSNPLGSLVSFIPDSQPPGPEEISNLHTQPLSPRLCSPLLSAYQEAQNEPSLVPARQSAPNAVAGPSPPIDIINSPEHPPKRRRVEAAPNVSTMAHDAPIATPIPQLHHTQTSPLLAPSIPSPPTTITSFLHSLPIEIHPPPPPILTSTFTTHITLTLSMLTQRLKPERIYKPLQQTRPLYILERGYWFLQIPIAASQSEPQTKAQPASSSAPNQNQSQLENAWDISFFQRFWTFLSDFIGKDARAGWGVWCIVENFNSADESSADANPSTNHSQLHLPLPSTASTDSDDPVPIPHIPESESDSGSISVSLKMYTWGEVAMHVYLLLFLASARKIRGMGAEWRDSREEVIIRMP